MRKGEKFKHGDLVKVHNPNINVTLHEYAMVNRYIQEKEEYEVWIASAFGPAMFYLTYPEHWLIVQRKD